MQQQSKIHKRAKLSAEGTNAARQGGGMAIQPRAQTVPGHRAAAELSGPASAGAILIQEEKYVCPCRDKGLRSYV